MNIINDIIQFLAVYTFTLASSLFSLALRVWVIIEVVRATGVIQYIKA